MKRIAVIPNYTKDIEHEYTKRLCRYLGGRTEIVMQEKDRADGISAKFVTGDVYENCDAVIILGGDGTMLQAAEPCGKRAIPVMGINLGKVGFMTEVEKEDMEAACDRILNDDFAVEERMMMEVTLCGKTYIALNDLVVSKPDAQMVSTEIYAGENKVSEYMSDGLIISTPTGSTGYSLSAGGPVADPAMRLFIATPICAHTLAARPMLMADYKRITLKLTDNGSSNAVVTVDGRVIGSLERGGCVTVMRSLYTLKTIKLGKQSFYHTMMAKL